MTERRVGPKARALIQSFEGCRLKSYPDPGTGGEPYTVGWGSTGPGIAKGVTWTQDQCDQRFDADIQAFGAKVSKLLGDAPTTAAQFGALTSFAYNVGIGNLASSSLLRMHKTGDYAGAQKQFARWDSAAGRHLPGLTRRRAAEAALYGERS